MNTDTRSPIGLKNDAEINRCVNDNKTTEMSNKKVTETVFERAWVIPDCQQRIAKIKKAPYTWSQLCLDRLMLERNRSGRVPKCRSAAMSSGQHVILGCLLIAYLPIRTVNVDIPSRVEARNAWDGRRLITRLKTIAALCTNNGGTSSGVLAAAEKTPQTLRSTLRNTSRGKACFFAGRGMTCCSCLRISRTAPLA